VRCICATTSARTVSIAVRRSSRQKKINYLAPTVLRLLKAYPCLEGVQNWILP
jgi:hypothetical protein